MKKDPLLSAAGADTNLESSSNLSAPARPVKRPRRPKRISKWLAVVRGMPPLPHWPDREHPFAVEKSQVVKWLIGQPHVEQWLFNAVRGRRLIIFDHETQTWRGREVAEARAKQEDAV